MDWHGTFRGGYALVCILLCVDDTGDRYNVCVTGTDDTHVNRWFDELAPALSLFNSITYLQSHQDLKLFFSKGVRAPGADNNGWPSARFIHNDEHFFTWPPPSPKILFDGVDYRHPEDGAAVPW
jgi:hypothetical protein